MSHAEMQDVSLLPMWLTSQSENMNTSEHSCYLWQYIIDFPSGDWSFLLPYSTCDPYTNPSLDLQASSEQFMSLFN